MLFAFSESPSSGGVDANVDAHTSSSRLTASHAQTIAYVAFAVAHASAQSAPKTVSFPTSQSFAHHAASSAAAQFHVSTSSSS